MDASISKALHDKLYDKRKGGALELERLIRECLSTRNNDRIKKIVDELCHDYAYAIHQPYARNGGLIGLAAASIALGPEVARYLEEIVPPVLACFSDQDARVRYYACESMYNIAKTSKGEILPYFNEVFDALAKLAADSELSVKNGAELLDRLMKDIICDSATTYISTVQDQEAALDDEEPAGEPGHRPPPAFSLPRLIPLLKERIFVLSPFTRMFLVSWITLLDSIPDLELVVYLPSFLAGLFRFLNDTNQDVVTATQHVLERFLDEIQVVSRVKREIAEEIRVKSQKDLSSRNVTAINEGTRSLADEPDMTSKDPMKDNENTLEEHSDSDSSFDEVASDAQDDWIPGQDVYIDHLAILDILTTVLRDAPQEHIQLTALRWLDSFFEICPEDILPFVPRILNQVLPAMSNKVAQVRQAGHRVNTSLMEYITPLPDDDERAEAPDQVAKEGSDGLQPQTTNQSSSSRANTPAPKSLDYEAAVNALTTQFLNEHEATRVAALSWLIMLQSKAPRQVLAAHDGTFPALLKTLSDTSDTVVTRDLQLLCQIAKKSDDSYFSFFMVNLLKLFSTDRRLLETRGNLIIRQLCLNLSPERIYRMMADCLEKETDVEFGSIMVQNLNNNLITAPELFDLRKKLRNWDNRENQTMFVTLFRAWCHNAIATISLCLLAQAYEQAYNLLQIFADIEMTVNMLIQIDKLVQLLESPVFTYLRLQLLEPDRFPYLYKCLYGILMLLPQSAAFAALKNRLNSVSSIGLLQISPTVSNTAAKQQPPLPGRIRREDGPVRWAELLDKFKGAQERANRPNRPAEQGSSRPADRKSLASLEGPLRRMQPSPGPTADANGNLGTLPSTTANPAGLLQAATDQSQKSKFSASRFVSGVKGKAKGK